MQDTALTTWLSLADRFPSDGDRDLLKKSYDYAANLSETAVSPYTTSTLDQGLKMALLLANIQCDAQTLAAAIAYPSIYYAHPSKDKVMQTLSPAVTKLIYGAARMEAIHNIHRQSSALNQQQIDNLRKMLLAIVDDVRIVLIRLAERLITLEYLKKCTEEQQQYIAHQALDFYAPLANRLGIGQLKWQLEDLALRYLDKNTYFAIAHALKKRRSERDAVVHDTMTELKQLLDNNGVINYDITGRSKHIYSIYKKMQRKQLPTNEIYDCQAVRVLVNSIADCYTTLSLAHDHWPHIKKEFDDYVANPKPNGYQSIHTVIVNHDINVEIQIRTFDMHTAAEGGVAAHWKYKEGASEKENYEEKIERLRELLKWQQEVTDDTQENVYESLFSDRIYTFTPQGDVFDLSAGSTPLDFAYLVHTSIGHRTKGAKVNDKIVPLTHRLETGDRVEIITSKHEQPSRDWMNPTLGYLKTSDALQKVRHWFKKQNYDKDLAAGLELFDKAVRHEDNINKADLALLTKRFNVKKAEDILVAIGSNNITATQVVQQLKHLKESDHRSDALSKPDIKLKSTTQHVENASDLIVEGVGNLLTHIAKCCKPIPGDSIIGFITTGRGVSIHHQDCPNIQHDLLTQPQRIIDVQWNSRCAGSYPIDLIITADDRSGLVRDISAIVAHEKLHFLGLTTQINRATNEAVIRITIELKNEISADYICKQMLHIPGVLKVVRP